MQAKLENITATNALTKEDLAISKNALLKAQEENHKLLNQLEMASSQLLRWQQRATEKSEERRSSSSESASSPTTSGEHPISKVLV